jgi:hypothetical protein
MSTTTMSLVPVESGWAVMLADGRELARFTGARAMRQALRYVATANPVRARPRFQTVDEMADRVGGWSAGRDSVEPDEDDSSSPRRA